LTVWDPNFTVLIIQQLTVQNLSVGRNNLDISGISIFRVEDKIIK